MIEEGDIILRLSTRLGSEGNTLAQADPNLSLGKYISTTPWAGGTLHDLFDLVTGDENYARESEYRCIFVVNNHPTLSLLNPVVWLPAQVSGGALTTIALDTTVASLLGSSAAQALEIVDENTAPGFSIDFFEAPSKAAGLSLGASLAPGYCRAIWIKRTTAATAAKNNDGFTIRVEGDTEY